MVVTASRTVTDLGVPVGGHAACPDREPAERSAGPSSPPATVQEISRLTSHQVDPAAIHTTRWGHPSVGDPKHDVRDHTGDVSSPS